MPVRRASSPSISGVSRRSSKRSMKVLYLGGKSRDRFRISFTGLFSIRSPQYSFSGMGTPRMSGIPSTST